MKAQVLFVHLLLSLRSFASSFVAPARIGKHALASVPSSGELCFWSRLAPSTTTRHVSDPPKRHRRSVASTQTMGLFGLGGLEILVIIAGIGVVLGPEKILDMVRSSGDTAEDYKRELSKVPDEFKKGMEEGEIEARSRKAKVIRKVVVKDKQDE